MKTLTCVRCRLEKPICEFWKKHRNPARCLRCVNGKPPKSSKGMIPRWRNPEHQAMATRGIKLAGKITLKQYLYLVDLGMDGEKIKNWTCHRASMEIARRKEMAEKREARETELRTEAEHAALDRQFDEALH